MQKHGCILFVMEVLSMLEHFCSMVGDIFFSELTMNDMRGQGTVSCQEFGHRKYNSTSSYTIRSRKEMFLSYWEGYSLQFGWRYWLCRFKTPVETICMKCQQILYSEIIILIHNFGNAFEERVRWDQLWERNSLQKGSHFFIFQVVYICTQI